jgi:uncharacterized RDD family membrane protein YckC
MSTVQIPTPFNIDLDFEIAAFHKRIFAYLVDLVIIVTYAWAMGKLLYNNRTMHAMEGAERWGGATVAWSTLIITLPILFYPLLTEILMHGQTVGKKLLNIRVVNVRGGEPSLSQYITRWIFRFFEWPLVFGVVLPGFLIVLQVMTTMMMGIVVIIIVAITKNHRRLGDLAANTVLVKTKIDTSINDTVFQEVNQKDYVVHFPQVMQLSDRDINTIKSILSNSNNKSGEDLAWRVTDRVKTALQINSSLHPFQFLDKLLQDYNYLATKE